MGAPRLAVPAAAHAHGTATGRAEGRRLLQAGDVQVWQPWDTPGAVRRFLRQFRPQLGVLMETEVWPNLVAGCRAAGVPLVLANARLNERSLAAAQRLRWLSARPTAASARSGPRPRTMRAACAAWARRCRRCWAISSSTCGPTWPSRPGAARWRAGSQRARAPRGAAGQLARGRGGGLIELAPQRGPLGQQRHPVAGVPRHPQRFEEVAALFRQAGLTVARRSQWGDLAAPVLPPQADVWLATRSARWRCTTAWRGWPAGGSFEPWAGRT
jgi:3-deoxy-D-manno-octulosonic-acid transferase